MKVRESKHLIYYYVDEPIFNKEIGGSLFDLKHWIIRYLGQYIYPLAYNLVKPKKNSHHKYKLSICAIFQDEANYLREWIEFHKIVGVEHFYLYNNNSSDNFMEILAPYISEEVVTLQNWPIKERPQNAAYRHYLKYYSHETKWAGFIDLDEFVTPIKYDNILEFLEGFQNRHCVVINWKIFGTSGIIQRDKRGCVTEDFTVAGRKHTELGKCFFNTEYDLSVDSDPLLIHHKMGVRFFKWHLPPVNVFGQMYTLPFCAMKTNDVPIQINHYSLKSYNEYWEKKSKRGGGYNDSGIHGTRFFDKSESMCTDVDYSAYKYLTKLKTALGIKGKG